VTAAKDPDAWAAFTARFLLGDEASYQQAVQTWREEKTAVPA
jgi:glutaconate CoA-transferase subunit A